MCKQGQPDEVVYITLVLIGLLMLDINNLVVSGKTVQAREANTTLNTSINPFG